MIKFLKEWFLEIVSVLRDPAAQGMSRIQAVSGLVLVIDGVYLAIAWVFFTAQYIIAKIPPGEYLGFVFLGLPISLFLTSYMTWAITASCE